MATLIPALGACVSRWSTTQRAGKPTLEIIPDGSPKSVPNPLDQSRAQLVHADGIPLLKLISCGRDCEWPLIIRQPDLRADAPLVPTF